MVADVQEATPQMEVFAEKGVRDKQVMVAVPPRLEDLDRGSFGVLQACGLPRGNDTTSFTFPRDDRAKMNYYTYAN